MFQFSRNTFRCLEDCQCRILLYPAVINALERRAIRETGCLGKCGMAGAVEIGPACGQYGAFLPKQNVARFTQDAAHSMQGPGFCAGMRSPFDRQAAVLRLDAQTDQLGVVVTHE